MATPSDLTTWDWRDSRPTLTDRISFFCKNKLASDVTFLVRGKSIPAHKFVLMANSSVFFAMFSGPLAEDGSLIKIDDCEEIEDFLQFLKYLYTEKCDLTWENVFSVLYFAKKYLVSSLTKLCVVFMSQEMKAENVLQVFQQAIKYNNHQLKKRSLQIISYFAEEIIKTDEFLSLDIEYLKVVLSEDQLNVSEVQLFKAIDLWCEKRANQMNKMKKASETPETKRSVLGDAIFLIRFPVMTASEFADNGAFSTLITSDEYRDIFAYIAKKDSALLESRSFWKRFSTAKRACKYGMQECSDCRLLRVFDKTRETTCKPKPVHKTKCNRCGGDLLECFILD